MTISASSYSLRAMVCGTALLALSACEDGFDLDMRGGLGNKFDTTDAAINATQNRPSPDARGIITYPNYQVAVAQRGDTVASVAARIGVDAGELARYNGLSPDTQLRRDEVLALRTHVSTLPASASAGQTAPGAVDITALAQGAIDSTPVTTSALPATTAAGPEPVRHRVARGETAFTIARLYNVSVRSLADWNGLDSGFSVREGQYLLIPVAQETAASAAPAPLAAATVPGAGTPTPTPPSAAQPLPDEETPVAAAPVETPPAPELPKPTQQASKAQMSYPVSGPIIREYAKGKNEGIDISASAGTPVKAAAAGTVAAITENTEGQPIIVVRHPDNLLTVYANVDGVNVKKGDKIARGQSMANVRAGGTPFLHFEVRKGFDSVDPLPFLQ